MLLSMLVSYFICLFSLYLNLVFDPWADSFFKHYIYVVFYLSSGYTVEAVQSESGAQSSRKSYSFLYDYSRK